MGRKGGITKNNGDYSGFSNDNFLEYVKHPFIETTDNCEIVLNITTSSLLSSGTAAFQTMPIMGFYKDNNYSFGIYGKEWYFQKSKTSTLTGGVVEPNTEYFVKFVCESNGQTSLYYKKRDDEEYSLAGSYIREVVYQIVLCGGVEYFDFKNAFNGVLHHDNTEIKFN